MFKNLCDARLIKFIYLLVMHPLEFHDSVQEHIHDTSKVATLIKSSILIKHKLYIHHVKNKLNMIKSKFSNKLKIKK